MTSTNHPLTYRAGRAFVNAIRSFNRFEARLAGRFTFKGRVAIKTLFWTVRIGILAAAAAVSIYLLMVVLLFILVAIIVAVRGVLGLFQDTDEETNYFDYATYYDYYCNDAQDWGQPPPNRGW